MATLDYSDIRPKKTIMYEGTPHEVLEYHVARTQQRKPQNQVKLRNLLNGKVIPATFHAADTVEEADISKKAAKFIYQAKGEYWFHYEGDQKNRFKIDTELLGDGAKWLKGDAVVDALIWTDDEDEEKIIGVRLPIKVTLEVKEAPPSIKGDTSGGGGKVVVLETGATVTAPLFVEAGDKIIINTETNEYVERAK
jgi:elongation factor P